MYATVLPYLGEDGASRELRIPPPPPGVRPEPGDEAADYPSRVPERGRGDGGGDGEALLGPLPSGRHGLSPEQVAESQRERLLAAAAEIVAREGYKATTIAAIAKRASVANRAFYDNFENKEACVWAAIEAVLDHARQRLVAAMSPVPDWTQRIVAGLREVLSFFTAEPELARLCLVVPLASTPGIATKYSDFVKFALPLLAAGRAERPENASLPAATEDQVLGGLLSLMARASNTGEQPLDELLPDLARFTLAPYLGEKRAGEVVASLPDSPAS
jgi:AcrR family transcriptional regulator